jgi:hypothetical protein
MLIATAEGERGSQSAMEAMQGDDGGTNSKKS